MEMNVSFSYVARGLIVMFWIAVIMLFLHVPDLATGWKTKRSISIMIWSELIDDAVIRDFQEKTGIKVYVSYMESNEELYAKIKATGGQGYDLLIPSDYTVSLLREDGILKKLNTSKLTMLDRLDRRYLHAYYDPEQEYSIPYFIQLYGIGIDKEYFKSGLPAHGWGLLFDTNVINYPVAMVDNPRENILLASYYLFSTIDSLTNDQLQETKNLLLRQKKFITAYTEMRTDYLLATRACPVALATSTVVWKMLKEYEFLDFIAPEGGSFTTVDNFVIPAASIKEDLVYEFLNYIYQPEILEHHFNEYRFFVATTDQEWLMKKYDVPETIQAIHNDPHYQLLYFRNVISEKIINDIWISLKAR